MRVFRFMSVNELVGLLANQTVTNTKNHKKSGNSTNSVGFCFTPINPPEAEMEAIFLAANYLSGVATMDICLLGAFLDPMPSKFKKTWGDYRYGHIDELSTTSYSLVDFDSWELYAPNDRYLFVPIASPNWADPKYVINSTDWEKSHDA